MEETIEFYNVFGTKPDLAYNHQTIEQIHRCRRALENELFFDRLLKAVGVDQGTSNLLHPSLILGLMRTYLSIKAISSTFKSGSPESLPANRYEYLPRPSQALIGLLHTERLTKPNSKLGRLCQELLHTEQVSGLH